MSKIKVDIDFIKALLEHAKKNNTLEQWCDVSIQYMDGCIEEIFHLKSVLKDVVDSVEVSYGYEHLDGSQNVDYIIPADIYQEIKKITDED